MKSCAEVRKNISAYADNELDIDKRLSLEEHIMNCPECKRELDEMIRIIKLCTELPQMELPTEFKAELHEKLIAVSSRRDDSVKSIKKSKNFSPRLFASLAAGILFIFLAGSMIRYGLLSGHPESGSASDSAMEPQMTVQSEAGGSQDSSEYNADAAATASEIGTADMQADGSDISFKSEAGMDYGVLEYNQSLAPPKGLEIDRSSANEDRDNGISISAGTVPEIVNRKSSTVTITTEELAAVKGKVTVLASVYNGVMQDVDQLHSSPGSTAVQSEPANTEEDEMRIQLELVFAESDYSMFMASINDTFGAANVQSGAFITEDLTDELCVLIDRSNMYDADIQKLQNENNDAYDEKITILSKEKEEIDAQIEKIRLNSDFITVTVYISLK